MDRPPEVFFKKISFFNAEFYFYAEMATLNKFLQWCVVLKKAAVKEDYEEPVHR